MTISDPYENKLEAACVRLASIAGYEHRKLDVGRGSKNWIDHAFWGPGGRHLLIEFKRPGEKMTPGQTVRFMRLAKMGHEIYEIQTLDDFEKLLEGELKWSNRM